MGLPKGRTNNPKGRTPGTRTKQTISVNKLIINVLDELGGKKWLKKIATENPTDFLKLLARMVKQEIDVSGVVEAKIGISESLYEKLNEIYSVIRGS
jgi:hypothetical protein